MISVVINKRIANERCLREERKENVLSVSKMVVDKRKSSEAVQAASSTHEDTIVAGIAEILDEEAAQAAAVLLRKARSRLGVVTHGMMLSDSEHIKELADDGASFQLRDTAFNTLYTEMCNLRESGNTVYGADYLQRLGFKGATPRDPVALEQLAGVVKDKLASEVPPSPLMRGFSLDIKAWLEPLETKRSALADALSAVAVEKREAEGTLVKKNQAIEQYDRGFSLTASLLSILLKTTGEDELADRVRPSARRAGQTVAFETETEPEPTGETAI